MLPTYGLVLIICLVVVLVLAVGALIVMKVLKKTHKWRTLCQWVQSPSRNKVCIVLHLPKPKQDLYHITPQNPTVYHTTPQNSIRSVSYHPLQNPTVYHTTPSKIHQCIIPPPPKSNSVYTRHCPRNDYVLYIPTAVPPQCLLTVDIIHCISCNSVLEWAESDTEQSWQWQPS